MNIYLEGCTQLYEEFVVVLLELFLIYINILCLQKHFTYFTHLLLLAGSKL